MHMCHFTLTEMTHTKLCVDPLDKNRQIFNDQKQVLRKVSSNFVSIQIGASKYLKHMMVRAREKWKMGCSSEASPPPVEQI